MSVLVFTLLKADPLTTDPKPRRGFRRWFFAAAILALVVAVAFLIRPRPESPFLHDPRFVVTSRPTISSSAPFTTRAFMWWQSIQKPRPTSWTFSPHATNITSINGMLNQCMEVTGVRYVMAKDVAAGSFQFGHTNNLNGAQWVIAITEALQHGNPEWWDSHAKKFHRENLVLITNDAHTVLVLPKAMAQDLRTPNPH